MKLDPNLSPAIKTNSKWRQALNVRPETIKLLEENNASGHWNRQVFFGQDPKALEMRTKSDKYNYIKLLYTAKKTHSREHRMRGSIFNVYI
jgi:hypothetical protein